MREHARRRGRPLFLRLCCCFLLFSLLPSLAQEIWVAPSSSAPCLASCGGNSLDACPSIRCALRRVKENDSTLRLLPGNFSGDDNVGISSGNCTSSSGDYGADDDPGGESSLGAPRGLSIVGSGPGDTVITCDGSRFDFFLVARGPFLAALANVTVTRCRGLSLLNASVTVSDAHFTDYAPPNRLNGTGIFAGDSGSSGSSSLLLERVVFRNLTASKGGALTVVGDVAVVARDSNFTANGMSADGTTVQTLDAGAVYLVGVTRATFERCGFQGNRAQAQGGAVAIVSNDGGDGDTSSSSSSDGGSSSSSSSSSGGGSSGESAAEGGENSFEFIQSVFEANGISAGTVCSADNDACESTGGAEREAMTRERLICCI